MEKKSGVEVKKRGQTLDLLIEGLKISLLTLLGMSSFASLMIYLTIGW